VRGCRAVDSAAVIILRGGGARACGVAAAMAGRGQWGGTYVAHAHGPTHPCKGDGSGQIDGLCGLIARPSKPIPQHRRSAVCAVPMVCDVAGGPVPVGINAELGSTQARRQM
jgi:hypothetical protein